MGLLDQLRLLDRALRDVRVREALRTGDRGGRRLARFAGSVAPADLAVLRAVDARRFEAVAQRQAEMIRDRWWAARFPGTLAGAARATAAGTREVAQAALASPYFDKREGEDETGVALLGWLLSREDKTEDPGWLADMVAYEYLVTVGLPRRARSLRVDEQLEQRALPEGTRFLEPQAGGKGGELAISKKCVVLPLEYPVSDVREAFRSGQQVADDMPPEPHALVFVLDGEGATEVRVPAPGHDILDLIAAAPMPGQQALAAIDKDEREAARQALLALVEAGVVRGTVPEPEPEPPPTPKGKKKAGKESAAPKAAPAPKGKAAPKKPAPRAPKAQAKKPAPKAKKPAPKAKKAPPKKPKRPALSARGRRR